MNVWMRRSLEMANSPGYLDQLSKIYPATRPPRRKPLPNNTKNEISRLHKAGDGLGLLTLFLNLRQEKYPFPFEHPYASLLSSYPYLFSYNPTVANEIGKALLSSTIDELIMGCERPVDINRAMGQAFRNWLRLFFPAKGYPFLPSNQFGIHVGSAFLDAADDKAIRSYIRDNLGFPLEKGRDFLAKVGTLYVVGEARFLSTYGGSQSRDITEAISFVRSAKSYLVAVAILDGVIWFYPSYVQLLSELGQEEYVLSALLLYEFLESLR